MNEWKEKDNRIKCVYLNVELQLRCSDVFSDDQLHEGNFQLCQYDGNSQHFGDISASIKRDWD
jgi:hypothetical protein